MRSTLLELLPGICPLYDGFLLFYFVLNLSAGLLDELIFVAEVLLQQLLILAMVSHVLLDVLVIKVLSFLAFLW